MKQFRILLLVVLALACSSDSGDDGYGHIYQLAEKIRNYFDPPVDDIPF